MTEALPEIDTLKLVDIFKRIFKIIDLSDVEEEAANYYVSLVKNKYPSTIKLFCDQTQMGYQLMINGRSELLEKGLIAKEIGRGPLTKKSDISKQKRIPSKKGEMYLPVNPRLIFEQYQNSLQISPEKKEDSETEINKFEKYYRYNFGEFGLGIEKKHSNEDDDEGHISVEYSSGWVFNTMINNLKPGHHVSMLIGGLASFADHRYLRYYERMLVQQDERSKIKLRILYNVPIKPKDDTKNYEELKKKYDNEIDKQKKSIKSIKDNLLENNEDNIQIRIKAVPHATTRRFIDEHVEPHAGGFKYNLAIDSRKILDLRSESNAGDEHIAFYQATIYLHDEDIDWLKIAFDEAWDRSEKLEWSSLS